jgi:hypothetical protein
LTNKYTTIVQCIS